MTPFLKVLQSDNRFKRRYLTQLRITTRFIQPCECQKEEVHAYCLTAKIVQDKKIFCSSCDGHFKFHLHAKSAVSIVSSILYYVIVNLLVIAFGSSVCLLDGVLKCRQSGADGSRTFTSRHSLVGQDSSAFGFFEDCVDMGALIRVEAIILPILFWSLYYSLIKKRSQDKDFKTMIEVLSVNDPR